MSVAEKYIIVSSGGLPVTLSPCQLFQCPADIYAHHPPPVPTARQRIGWRVALGLGRLGGRGDAGLAERVAEQRGLGLAGAQRVRASRSQRDASLAHYSVRIGYYAYGHGYD